MLDQRSAAPVYRGGRGQVAGDELAPSPAVPDAVTTKLPSSVETDDVGVVIRLNEGLYLQVVKPAVDRIMALAALVVAAPFMAVIALAIRLTMGRGVVFVQTRVGKDGRPFVMYKFRTMRPDRRRHSLTVPVDRRKTHKHPNDPRLTAVGRFLRKWSLDELPQFLNVARGDMSLVGPRPEMVDIVDRYEPWQDRRHAVKPGLTGLWQISDRGDLLMHECVERDIEYIKRLSWRTDLSILLRTPAAMLGSRRGF
jgi:lipopolysaccharide/colanic/teichoic acid biosynthesis glycosyltransferase